MLLRLTRSIPNVFSRTLRHPFQTPTYALTRFSTFSNPADTTPQTPLNGEPIDKTPVEDSLSSINPHINSYMKQLYQYLATASIVGLSTAHFLAHTVPVGFPSAFLIITGFGLQHIGAEYADKIKPNMFVTKGEDGKMQYGTSSPVSRQIAFLTSCVGYGCIIGSLLGLVPLAGASLPLSAISCLFSTLGHMNYTKFAPKSSFKPAHVFLSGLFTGVLGLNLITSGSSIFMWESPLQLESLEVSSYLGLLLYNAFTANDSQKTVEDIRNGKGDPLKHANKFSENWLYSMIPHFLMALQ